MKCQPRAINGNPGNDDIPFRGVLEIFLGAEHGDIERHNPIRRNEHAEKLAELRVSGSPIQGVRSKEGDRWIQIQPRDEAQFVIDRQSPKWVYSTTRLTLR